MMRKLFPVGWYFELLYFGVAIATFEHTAWAFGTTFLGLPATEYFNLSDPIWLRGGLVALAVDIGMFLVARAAIQEGSRENKNRLAIVGLYATFVVIGLISFFSQIVFAIYHTPDLAIAPGVSTYWAAFLQPIVEAAPFIMAGALPFMAVLFTISRVAMTTNERSIVQAEKQEYKIVIDDKVKIYDSLVGLKRALSRYKGNGKKIVIPEQTKLLLESGN